MSTMVQETLGPCTSHRMAHGAGGKLLVIPCPYPAVRTLTIGCEEGHIVTDKPACKECAARVIENIGWCFVCLLEHGRASRLSTLETE